MEGRKEFVLFNNALKTFYLLSYGVTHMVKDHSDNEIGSPLSPHELLFPISNKGSFRHQKLEGSSSLQAYKEIHLQHILFKLSRYIYIYMCVCVCVCVCVVCVCVCVCVCECVRFPHESVIY